jgi:hypothetical protein
MTPTSSGNVANVLKRRRDDDGPSTTAAQAPPVRELQLARQPAPNAPRQPPLPLHVPGAQPLHGGAEFRLLFPDAKAIVLSYLPGVEICIFVDPQLWELVKDSPAVHAFLQATQAHAGLAAAQARVRTAMSDNLADQRQTLEAAQLAGAVRLTLGRALTCATIHVASPEHLQAQAAYAAADSAYEVATRALQSALARPSDLEKELKRAVENLFGAHIEMRKGLDAIRWVGAPYSMSALGILVDYSDKNAPLDPAAALGEKEQLQAEGAQKSGQ